MIFSLTRLGSNLRGCLDNSEQFSLIILTHPVLYVKFNDLFDKFSLLKRLQFAAEGAVDEGLEEVFGLSGGLALLAADTHKNLSLMAPLLISLTPDKRKAAVLFD